MNIELIATYAKLSLLDQMIPTVEQRYHHTGRKREWCRCGECDGCIAEEQQFHELDDLLTEQERLQARMAEVFTPTCADPAPRHVSELVYLVEQEHNEAYDLFSPEEKQAYDAYANEMQAEYDAFMECEYAAQQLDAEREEEKSVHDPEECDCDDCFFAYLKRTDCDERSFDF